MKYRCNICLSCVIEAPKVPEICPDCASQNGPWLNIATGKVEKTVKYRKPLLSETKPYIPPFVKPKKIIVASATGKPPVGVPPKVIKPVKTPPPARTPVLTPSGPSFASLYYGDVINVIRFAFRSIITWGAWVLGFVLLVLSGGKILNFPWRLGVSVLALFFVVPLLFNLLNINKKSYMFIYKLTGAALLLFVIAFPYDHVFQKKYERYPTGNSQPTNQSYRRTVLYFIQNQDLLRYPQQYSSVVASIQTFDSAVWYGKQQENWIEIIFNGSIGWVYKQAGRQIESPQRIRLRIKAGMTQVNMRRGPSTSYSILKVLDRTDELQFFTKSVDKKWLFVKDQQGRKGWVWKGYFDII